jgi:hypothetical protein
MSQSQDSATSKRHPSRSACLLQAGCATRELLRNARCRLRKPSHRTHSPTDWQKSAILGLYKCQPRKPADLRIFGFALETIERRSRSTQCRRRHVDKGASYLTRKRPSTEAADKDDDVVCSARTSLQSRSSAQNVEHKIAKLISVVRSN